MAKKIHVMTPWLRQVKLYFQAGTSRFWYWENDWVCAWRAHDLFSGLKGEVRFHFSTAPLPESYHATVFRQRSEAYFPRGLEVEGERYHLTENLSNLLAAFPYGSKVYIAAEVK